MSSNFQYQTIQTTSFNLFLQSLRKAFLTADIIYKHKHQPKTKQLYHNEIQSFEQPFSQLKKYYNKWKEYTQMQQSQYIGISFKFSISTKIWFPLTVI